MGCLPLFGLALLHRLLALLGLAGLLAGVRLPDGCSAFGLSFAAEPEVDAPPVMPVEPADPPPVAAPLAPPPDGLALMVAPPPAAGRAGTALAAAALRERGLSARRQCDGGDGDQ